MPEAQNTTPATDTPPAPKPAAETAAQKPTPPPRVLPSQEDIAAWIEGAEMPTIGTLFEGLVLARYDGLIMQVRKEELLPQHWQVISELQAPPDEEFDLLPEVGRLRVRYKDQELARHRIENLRLAWRELRGRRPTMWTVPDLFAAIRRIIERKREVDFNALLTAARDVWADMSLPMGREQLHMLWNCLALIRKKTKK